MINYLAQNIGVGQLGCTVGELCTAGPSDAPGTFNRIISTTIGVLTIIAFIWFTFQVIIGAYSIISAGGDKGKVAEGQKKIGNGVAGVVIVVAAVFIVQIVGLLLGLDSITDVGGALDALGN